MKKTIIKLTSIMLTLIFLINIAGCAAEKPVATQAEPPKETKIEIKFFSNLPDRASGQGKLMLQGTRFRISTWCGDSLPSSIL